MLDKVQQNFINEFKNDLLQYLYKYSDTFYMEYTRSEALQELTEELEAALNGQSYIYRSILKNIHELENTDNMTEAQRLTHCLMIISLFNIEELKHELKEAKK